MTASIDKTIEEIIDDDPIPWYKVSACSEEEKMLSYVSIHDMQYSDLQHATHKVHTEHAGPGTPVANLDTESDAYGVYQAQQCFFQGEWGTTFQPPGFEGKDVIWSGMIAKHPPPGLAVPNHILHSRGYQWHHAHQGSSQGHPCINRSGPQVSLLPQPQVSQELVRSPLVYDQLSEGMQHTNCLVPGSQVNGTIDGHFQMVSLPNCFYAPWVEPSPAKQSGRVVSNSTSETSFASAPRLV